MSRIETEFPFPNQILGSFGTSSINDDLVKDLAKARHSAGKESIRHIKIKKIIIDSDEDLELLQQDLENLERWSTMNGMKFNGKKL